FVLPDAGRSEYGSGMNPGQRGGVRYDFAVYDSQGRLSALVDAMRRFGRDSSWAVAWHAMAMERMDQPANANVVVIMPDRIYAWRPGAGASAAPDWTLDAGPLLAPYFARLKIPVAEVHPHVFEEIVASWLRDAVQGEMSDGSIVEGAEGLLDALRGGEVVQQVAA
ncbi:MAG: hypothetical protein ABI134_17280, partial [Byssovorax sp.]